ncbi:MAG: hypothetical protein JXB03_04265, partial [Spirochaetales bacterium]|nr:hypothetical protein [Spirochaetales bacterium]
VAVRSIVAGRADSFTLTGVILWNMGYLLFLFAGIVWILKKEQYPFSVKAVKTVLARSLFSRYSKSKR